MMRILLISVAAWYAVYASEACAQELEPFAYAQNPIGANFLVAGYGETWGDILFDPSSPLSDVDASWHSVVFGYGHTFGMFGRSANFALIAPYAWGDARGTLEGERGEITRRGLADPRFRFGINLFGSPALGLQEFSKSPPGTTVGVTFIVAPPIGQYLEDKLINIGSNRWSIKSEVGISHPVNKWRFDFAAGVWWFSDNDEFLGDGLKKQDAVATFQGHVIYSFRRQFWIAIDANWYRGGSTTINGTGDGALQSNSRVGITGSYPIGNMQSLKLAYSQGAATRIGGDFKQFTIAWQYTWF